MKRRDASDPTRVTAQPALSTSAGGRWLAWGAALGVIGVVVLGFLAITRVPAAWVACGVIAALYLAMVIVRLAVRPRRARLLTMASLMGAMAAVALVSVVLVGVVSARGA